MTEGIAEIRFAVRDSISHLAHLYQRDPLRVLFPTPALGDPPLAVLVTTSGGLVAGDRLDIGVRLASGAAAHVTASAAEKIYRSTGATTVIRQTLSVGADAALEFLPLGTILFDGARLSRETTVDLAAGAWFLGGDIVVLGRRASGERFAAGLLREVWQVRRDGRLVWGDSLLLDGDVAAIINNPACFAGAAAFATMIMVPPKQILPQLLQDARRLLSARTNQGLRSGVTAVEELMVARWLGADTGTTARSLCSAGLPFSVSGAGIAASLTKSLECLMGLRTSWSLCELTGRRAAAKSRLGMEFPITAQRADDSCRVRMHWAGASRGRRQAGLILPSSCRIRRLQARGLRRSDE